MSFFKPTTEGLIKEMKTNSEELVTLADEFQKWLCTHPEDVKIMCFYESKNMNINSLVCWIKPG